MKNFLMRLFLPYSWRVFKKPVVGEEWGRVTNAYHPWDNIGLIIVYVKDVRNEWVCYTFSRMESRRKSAPSLAEDEFVRIGEFKELYAHMDWLKKEVPQVNEILKNSA